VICYCRVNEKSHIGANLLIYCGEVIIRIWRLGRMTHIILKTSFWLQAAGSAFCVIILHAPITKYVTVLAHDI